MNSSKNLSYCDIAFSNLRFRLHGLSDKDSRFIVDRFGNSDAHGGQSVININVSRQLLKTRSASYYTGENGYQPKLNFSRSSLEIEGYDFEGRIDIENETCGSLFCNETADNQASTAYENFLRMISSYALLRTGGLFMHSAAVVLDGKAYLFIGRSNAGKTTISQMALDFGAQILSDDANIVQKKGQSYHVGAVPFAGELGLQSMKSGGPFVLSGIFVLEKHHCNEVVELGRAQQIAGLLVSAPVVNKDPYNNSTLMNNIETIIDNVRVAKLRFVKTEPFNEIFRMIGHTSKVAA